MFHYILNIKMTSQYHQTSQSYSPAAHSSIHQSLQRHQLDDNGGLLNFTLMLVI